MHSSLFIFTRRAYNHMLRTLRILLIIVLSLSILALTSSSSYLPLCLALKGDQRDIIDAREMLNTEENVMNCMTLSLLKGRVGQTRSILDLYGQQYQQQLMSILQRQLHRLELIEEQIIQGESNCPPVVKWGQNLTHIFLSMKMSHRWDSPPCLNTRSENTTLKDSLFQYINVCVVSHQKITFNLTLKFYQQVKDTHPEVIKDGVGTFSAIIEKEESQVWPFLDKTEVCHPIWDEIAERYNQVHKQYTDLLNGILRERRSKPVQFEENRRRRKRDGETLEDILVEAAVEEAIKSVEKTDEQPDQNQEQQTPRLEDIKVQQSQIPSISQASVVSAANSQPNSDSEHSKPQSVPVEGGVGSDL